jgi:hypothetical protein
MQAIIDTRADELHDILDCSPETLDFLAQRIEDSRRDDMRLIYRETEIDELWRWVDVGLGQSEHLRAAQTTVSQWRSFKAEVMRIHDMVGIDTDLAAAAQDLRSLAEQLRQSPGFLLAI